jgi:predicted PurR-regulated permease PerM
MEGLEVRSRNQLVRALAGAAITAIIFLFVWSAWELLLLAFAGLLLGVILDTICSWISDHTGLGPHMSYALTILGILAVIGLVLWLVAPRAIYEAGQIAGVIPKSLAQARETLDKTKWGHYIVEVVHRGLSSNATSTGLKSLATGAVAAVGGIVVVVVVGFYAALNPGEYTGGLLRLFPQQYRARAKEVGKEVVYTLRWWLLGQLVPMVVLGAATMIALWILHVPLAFTLGLLTGLMIFIPYLGALAAGIPSVLVALQQGPHIALIVLIVYLGIHMAEGYILTPLVQKRAVRLPPILTILAQLLMWILTGLLGVAVATPLAASVLVMVKMLYLHEPIEH